MSGILFKFRSINYYELIRNEHEIRGQKERKHFRNEVARSDLLLKKMTLVTVQRRDW